jgi:Tfp pilus assembly protein PilV
VSRTLRKVTPRRQGPGRRSSADGGMSLIEVLVALGLLVTVMLASAGFFVTSLKHSSGQVQNQTAATLANQQLEYTRSVAATSLLSGRTQPAVQAAIAAPGIADLSQDVTTTGNYDPAATASSSQAVPISMQSTVSGTVYTITTFIDQCYVAYGPSGSCTGTDAGNGWIYRVTANVAWKLAAGRSCPTASKACQFVVSTLRDPGSDPCFNVNVTFAGCSTSQPTIITVTPNTVVTNTTTSITLTGTNFDPGAAVKLDTGGTVSNVVVLSSTSLTFTLVTDNTAAAVGTRVITLTNPNGKFALGTMTITASVITCFGVLPNTVATGTTTPMTISGSGFQSGAVVSVPATAGIIVPGSTVVSANSISFSFQAANTVAAVSSWSLTVTNPDGANRPTSFQVTKAPVTLTGVNPASMAYGSTRAFTLTGSNFDSGAGVTLDGAAVSATWVSPTSLTVALGSDPAVGTRTFVVTNPDSGTASHTFSVSQNPMTFTAISPATMAFGFTRSFTLTGTNFLAGVGVTLDGATVPATRVSATSLSLTLASDPAFGTHTFVVTNPDGGNGSRTFVVTTHIVSLTPTSWAKNTSKLVTITAANFVTTGGGSAKISVNGSNITLASLTSTTATFSFTSNASAGPHTYPVQVTNKDGTLSDIFNWTVTGT